MYLLKHCISVNNPNNLMTACAVLLTGITPDDTCLPRCQPWGLFSPQLPLWLEEDVDPGREVG